MAARTKSQELRWSGIRRISQWCFFAAFLVLIFATIGLKFSTTLLQIQTRLSPLLMIAQIIASRIVVAGSLFGLFTLLLTIIFGRAWCGWICPVGTVLDLFPVRKPKNHREERVPEGLRQGKVFLLLVILIAAVAGNLTLLFLDPLTLWIRTMTGSVLPALNTAFTALERLVVQIPGMSDSVVWLDQRLRPAVFPDTLIGSRFTWLPILLFTGIVLLNWFAERFWCRYLCPLGGLLGMVSRLALIQRRVNADCKECALCSRRCPTGTIDPARGYQSDPSECVVCMDCLDDCSSKAVSFRFAWPKPEAAKYDPDRRAVLASALVGLTGAAVLKSDQTNGIQSPFLIRPPGVIEAEFLSKCERCGLCMRTCPTGALQPSLFESGVSGLFTPVLVPRLGYCQFSCNRCGQSCPVEAIPLLPLEEKQQTVIGRAYLNRNRCIPWAESNDCIVCQEMCPLPDKAIYLEEKQVTMSDGEIRDIKLPVVIAERCIGCGICETKCPQGGEAAIRVYRIGVSSYL